MLSRRFLFNAFLLAILAIFLGISPLFGQSQVCARSPVIFADDGLRGQSLEVTSSIQDLEEYGMGDEASSVCVPEGWRVILYSDEGFRGDRLELQGTVFISDLKRDRPQGVNWGDRISSIQVFRPRPRFGGRVPSSCNEYPILFHDDGFRGGNLRLQDSESDLGRQGIGDGASSVCVPAGWRVVLYEHDRYGGDRLEIVGPDAIEDLKRDRPNNQNWGDRISSVQVYRERQVPGQPGQPGPGQPGTPAPLPVPTPSPPRPAPAPTPVPTQAPAECNYRPLLFMDGSFRGRSLRIDQSISDLHAQGWGDAASSVCVPSGWTVVLFSDTRFRGERLELRGRSAVADLHRAAGNWGDRVSSLQVVQGAPQTPSPQPPPPQSSALQVPCSDRPVIYADNNFQGRSLIITSSVADLHSLEMGDVVSSVCIPAGWQVDFYEDAGFRGRMLRLTTGSIADLNRARPDGTDWGDRISSVRVSRTR